MDTLSHDEIGLPIAQPGESRSSGRETTWQRAVASLLQVHPVDAIQPLTTLDEDVCYVGRDRSCQIRICDRSVSRQHAVFRSTDHGWQLTDLGSTNGTLINEEVTSSAMLRQGDRIQFGSFVFKYLNSLHVEQQYHDAVANRIQQDDMLDVMNKRAFLERFARSYQQAIYQNSPLTVAMLDLDHFKEVNDRFGHQAGDEVLRECVKRIETVLPNDCSFARYGGEEFVLMFEGLDLEQTLPHAEAILKVIASTQIQTSSGSITATLSIGLADNQQVDATRDRDGTALINLADTRLYLSKRQGRNQISL